MAIPKYEEIMLPFLRLLGDGKEHSNKEVVGKMEEFFGLSESDKKISTKRGRQSLFYNRIGWAVTYLKQAGLITTPKRGLYIITNRGKDLLATNLPEIKSKDLKQYKEFADFIVRTKKETTEEKIDATDQTPEEIFESAYQKLKSSLAFELLENIKGASPSFFERAVIDLLVSMGYGGSMEDAGQAVGHSGDEGIDGIIKEDKLGLDVIYIQAKRWKDNSIGRPEIQKFAGALQGKRAKKGIFITTSSFTKDARSFVENIDSRIILIDGDELANLMIDYNVGVTRTDSYELKRLDSDYFAEE